MCWPLLSAGFFLMISATATFAQSPDDENGAVQQDPDVIAAEEFVRELREPAEKARAAERAACEASESCTTIDQLIVLMTTGHPSVEPESASGTENLEGGDLAEEDKLPDE